jgi:hypothetical protein
MEEIWKDIQGYEGLYQVSNLGRIKSLGRTIKRIGPKGKIFDRTYPEKVLKYGKDKKGYYRTVLSLDGINTTVKVHRIVAQTFIPNPENKPQVNHIDGNKTNNRIDNLEWCNNQENQDHSWKTGLRKRGKEHWSYGKQPQGFKKYYETHKGIRHPSYGVRGIKNSNSKKVIQYDKCGNYIRQWNSMADIYRELKISTGCVCNCCKGKRKTAGGYVWKYKE